MTCVTRRRLPSRSLLCGDGIEYVGSHRVAEYGEVCTGLAHDVDALTGVAAQLTSVTARSSRGHGSIAHVGGIGAFADTVRAARGFADGASAC